MAAVMVGALMENTKALGSTQVRESRRRLSFALHWLWLQWEAYLFLRLCQRDCHLNNERLMAHSSLHCLSIVSFTGHSSRPFGRP
jgi:hypothetical protein